mgnify:CR=1 FL=1
MTPKIFYLQLASVSCFVALALLIINSYEIFLMHQTFSWICMLGFIVFCSLLYALESITVDSQDKSLFGKIFLMFILFKFLFCCLMIIVYVTVKEPQNMYFILPFFIIYLVYTIYEVYFVSKLANS